MRILASQRLEASYELDAMATIYRDPKGRFLVSVNPDPNRSGDEYFKLYNKTNRDSATKIARISFRKAEYIHYSMNQGKEDWILNAREKKYIIKAFTKKNPAFYGGQYTYWQFAIAQFNLEKGLDYEKTFKNVGKKLKYPKYLPFDLEMPDYTKL